MKKLENIGGILPIAPSLIKKKYRNVLTAYLDFIKYVKFINDDHNSSSMHKVKELSSMEDAFFEEPDNNSDKFKIVANLKENFVKQLLAPALMKDIIATGKKEASNFQYETWGQLVAYYSNSTGTIARFLLALYDENPATYLPAMSLSVAFQMLTNIGDMKNNIKILKKTYIPQDLLKEHNVDIKQLHQNKSSKEVKKMIAEIAKEAKKMLKEAEILPSITQDLLLRMQFCMIISATYILLNKITNNDVLKKRITLNRFDIFNAYLTGIIEGMFTSYKSVNTKGLKK